MRRLALLVFLGALFVAGVVALSAGAQTAGPHIVWSTTSLQGVNPLHARAQCPAGESVTSGGFWLDPDAQMVAKVTASFSDGRGAWWVHVLGDGSAGSVKVMAVCER